MSGTTYYDQKTEQDIEAFEKAHHEHQVEESKKAYEQMKRDTDASYAADAEKKRQAAQEFQEQVEIKKADPTSDDRFKAMVTKGRELQEQARVANRVNEQAAKDFSQQAARDRIAKHDILEAHKTEEAFAAAFYPNRGLEITGYKKLQNKIDQNIANGVDNELTSKDLNKLGKDINHHLKTTESNYEQLRQHNMASGKDVPTSQTFNDETKKLVERSDNKTSYILLSTLAHQAEQKYNTHLDRIEKFNDRIDKLEMAGKKAEADYMRTSREHEYNSYERDVSKSVLLKTEHMYGKDSAQYKEQAETVKELEQKATESKAQLEAKHEQMFGKEVAKTQDAKIQDQKAELAKKASVEKDSANKADDAKKAEELKKFQQEAKPEIKDRSNDGYEQSKKHLEAFMSENEKFARAKEQGRELTKDEIKEFREDKVSAVAKEASSDKKLDDIKAKQAEVNSEDKRFDAVKNLEKEKSEPKRQEEFQKASEGIDKYKQDDQKFRSSLDDKASQRNADQEKLAAYNQSRFETAVRVRDDVKLAHKLDMPNLKYEAEDKRRESNEALAQDINTKRDFYANMGGLKENGQKLIEAKDGKVKENEKAFEASYKKTDALITKAEEQGKPYAKNMREDFNKTIGNLKTDEAVHKAKIEDEKSAAQDPKSVYKSVDRQGQAKAVDPKVTDKPAEKMSDGHEPKSVGKPTDQEVAGKPEQKEPESRIGKSVQKCESQKVNASDGNATREREARNAKIAEEQKAKQEQERAKAQAQAQDLEQQKRRM